MRIAFDHRVVLSQRHGGIARYVTELARNLAELDGINPRIFALGHTNRHLRGASRRGQVAGFARPSWVKLGSGAMRANDILLPAWLARFRPEILHETYYSEGIRKASGHRVVVTVYDMIHERFPQMFPPGDNTVKLKWAAVRRADHVFCISQTTRTDLLNFHAIDAGKITVTHLAPGLKAAGPIEQAARQPFLLYVGSRSRYKNFARFVVAAGSMASRHGFRLVCAGGGPLTSAELRSLRRAGFRADMVKQTDPGDSELVELYRTAACLIYPSLYEGFGLPVLEAMQFGCPVVCSRGGALPEVAGDAAEYFDPCCEHEMREAIIRVVDSPARMKELATRGRERAAQFSWRRCAEQTAATYRTLV